MHVEDAAHVRADGVDGGVGAEGEGVDAQGGGALFHHLAQDVHLHLEEQEGASISSTERTALYTRGVQSYLTRASVGGGFCFRPALQHLILD